MLNTKKRLKNSYKEKKEEYNKLEEKLFNMNRGEITVNNKIYPGVNLTISKSCYKIFDEMESVKFFNKEGEITHMNL